MEKTIISVGLFPDVGSLVFEADKSLVEEGTWEQMVQYARGEKVNVSGKTVQRRNSGASRSTQSLDHETSDDTYRIRVNGKPVSKKAPVRGDLERKLFKTITRNVTIDLSHHVPGLTYQTKSTTLVVKSFSDVQPSQRGSYQPFFYAKVEVGRPQPLG